MSPYEDKQHESYVTMQDGSGHILFWSYIGALGGSGDALSIFMYFCPCFKTKCTDKAFNRTNEMKYTIAIPIWIHFVLWQPLSERWVCDIYASKNIKYYCALTLNSV